MKLVVLLFSALPLLVPTGLCAQETRDYSAKILDRVENYKHLDVG